MPQVTMSPNNANRPAPKWWRKLENGLLMVLIPAIVAILMGWGFADEAFANKLITQYAPIFKSFQFVIYNSSSNIYKFITSNWIDFIVTSNGSSDYVLD